MKIKQLISEINFSMYQAVIRVTHSKDERVQDVGELLRGVPGVLTIAQVDHNSDAGTATMKVKVITTKTPKEAFEAFRSNAVTKLPIVKKIEIAYNTVEKK